MNEEEGELIPELVVPKNEGRGREYVEKHGGGLTLRRGHHDRGQSYPTHGGHPPGNIDEPSAAYWSKMIRDDNKVDKGWTAEARQRTQDYLDNLAADETLEEQPLSHRTNGNKGLDPDERQQWQDYVRGVKQKRIEEEENGSWNEREVVGEPIPLPDGRILIPMEDHGQGELAEYPPVITRGRVVDENIDWEAIEQDIELWAPDAGLEEMEASDTGTLNDIDRWAYDKLEEATLEEIDLMDQEIKSMKNSPEETRRWERQNVALHFGKVRRHRHSGTGGHVDYSEGNDTEGYKQQKKKTRNKNERFNARYEGWDEAYATGIVQGEDEISRGQLKKTASIQPWERQFHFQRDRNNGYKPRDWAELNHQSDPVVEDHSHHEPAYVTATQISGAYDGDSRVQIRNEFYEDAYGRTSPQPSRARHSLD